MLADWCSIGGVGELNLSSWVAFECGDALSLHTEQEYEKG